MKSSASKKTKRHVNVGRSIEEIIVRRQFDSTNPTTWPDPLKGSVKPQTLPIIASEVNVVSKPANYLSDYPEDDKQMMMDTLMSYCRALQNKVEDLEGQLLASSNKSAGLFSRSYDFGAVAPRSAEYFNQKNIYTGSTPPVSEERVSRIRIQSPGGQLESATPSSGGGRRNTAAAPLTDKLSSEGNNQQQMSKIMSSIDIQVVNLKELFRRGDPMDERKACATKIAALIRGFLARQQVALYRRSLREFTVTRCRMVIYLVDMLLSNQSKLDAGFHLLKMNRNMKKLHVVFLKWATVCHQNAPVRRAVKVAAAEKIENKRLELLRLVFRGLHSVSIGTHSTKHANAVRRKLIEGIRAELSFKLRTEGSYGVVPEAEITKVLHRRVVQNFWERKNQILSRFVFKTFVAILTRSRLNSKSASFNRFKQLAGKCFMAWSSYIYLVGMGLDRRRWPGPRKYEVKYNQKRVNNFSRVRQLKTIFKAWKAYFSIQYKVKLRFRQKVAQLVAAVFRGWKEATAHQHKLRMVVYDNWKGYARLMVYSPFHAWANHVKAVKNHHNEQIRICNSYVRWKWRQRIIHIVKVWRHQALYGRLDGLYSRQMLLKTLGEQKILVNSVEKAMTAQTMELEDCRNIVAAEIVKRKELEKTQATHISEISKLKMTTHNYEQEVRKLESVVESMVKINPKQIAYIRNMHPHFKFRERNILLPSRGENDSVSQVSEGGAMSDILQPITGVSAEDTLQQMSAVEASTVSNGSAVVGESVTHDNNSVMSAVNEHDELNNNDDDNSVVSALSAGTATRHTPAPDSLLPPEPSLDLHTAASSAGSVHSGGNTSAAKSGTAGTVGTVSAATFHTPNSVGAERKADLQQQQTQAIATEGAADKPAGSLSPTAPTASGAVGGVSEAASGSTNKQSVSDEDLLLLTRVKWIIARYADELKHHEMEQHKQPALDLLLPKETEDPVDRLDKEEGAEPEDPAGEFDVDSLVLKDRPALLMKSLRKTAVSPTRSSFQLTRQSSGALSRMQSTRISFSTSVSDFGPPYPLTTQPSSASMYETASNAGGFGGSSVSAKILLAFMDFLDFGDISLFTECDRRDWIRHLLKKTSENVALNNEFAGLTGEFPEDVSDVLENRAETPSTPFTADQFDAHTTLVTLDNNLNGAKSWRDALMQFRCFVNNDPSVIANLKDENVNETDIAMFGRILAMRDNSETIMKRQTAKFRAKLKEKVTYQFGANASEGMIVPVDGEKAAVSPTDELFPKAVSDPPMLGSNIYSSNLKLMRGETRDGFVGDIHRDVAVSRKMTITDEDDDHSPK